MSMSDPVSDMLTRIRNAHMVRKATVHIPLSNMKKRISEILVDEGYIEKFEIDGDSPATRSLVLHLKYYAGKPVIETIERLSKPGRRTYANKDEIPVINQGLGICIISTSKGVISNREAKKLGVGGELICSVF
ncbi:MAG: 30S ribosomal protein S8 [Magnetococcales bacterium]|nr:30S ribosomal protein S8 [Magnetococcales bacterium]